MAEAPFFNASPFHAEALPQLDRDGRECRLVVVKATFVILADGKTQLAETQRALRHGDELWGAPEIEDLRFPGDLALHKPGTDVVIAGYAYAPPRTSPRSIDVTVQLGPAAKRLRVHGPRVWKSGFLGVHPSDAEPLTRMAMRWGNSFGGRDDSDPAKPLEEKRNPAGSGVVRNAELLVGLPAPTIEDPSDAVTSAGGRHRPVGIAPIGRTYTPRRDLAGTYDQDWLERRYPARPLDYKPEHENCAPTDQHFDTPWKGGEAIQIDGMSPDGRLQALLPAWRIVVEETHDGETTEFRPHLDTVIVDTEARLLELVWRHAVTLSGGRAASLERIATFAKAVL